MEVHLRAVGAADELRTERSLRFGDLHVRLHPTHAAARSGSLDVAGDVFVVVQKGRSFQHANPDARILVDKGRYLVASRSRGTSWAEEKGCFAFVPFDDAAPGFHVETREATQRVSAVDQVLSRVRTETLRAHVASLSQIHTRHSLGAGLLEALEYCEGVFQEAGYQSVREPVPMPGGQTFNLVAQRSGAADDARLLIVCGHLDSVNHDGGPDALAPGANDNATGSATVLQAAQAITSLGETRHDVRFILYGGEEQGLFGSEHHVARMSESERARVAGVVNVDMAGSLNTERPTVLLEGAEVSRRVIDELAVAAATYTGLETQVSLDPFASDHVPFIDAGMPGVLTIEGADGAYEHEHTARDTIDRLDFELHREITAMDVAWLAGRSLAAD